MHIFYKGQKGISVIYIDVSVNKAQKEDVNGPRPASIKESFFCFALLDLALTKIYEELVVVRTEHS